MHCMACISSVEKELYKLSGVEKVDISLEHNGGSIEGESLPSIEEIEQAVSKAGDYELIDSKEATDLPIQESNVGKGSYKPLILVALYLLGFTGLLEWSSGMFLWETWMPNFMAGFFIVFSFFKMLDISGFARAYRGYDLIAKRVKIYAYAFPFIELGLGLAYLLIPDQPLTHLVTAVIMFVSLLGVVNAVWRKQQIQCACLGTVFNLPMSSVTIIEDSIMLIMALIMYLK
ncbi:MAG: heavy metal translocating P-type ATPase [Bacteroidia bacterium]